MFRILVVEDDADLNSAVCTYLRKNGFDAEGCYNTTQAYSAMYDNVHDLIISDIMMPGEDGFEFAKNIRKLSTNIPILFMTARDDIASKQLGYNLGIDGINKVNVSLEKELAEVEYDELKVNADKMIETIKELEYEASI